MDSIKNWLFYAEDENGDGHYIHDWFFVGTYQDACNYADIHADEFEKKTGGLILKLVIESHGTANKPVEPTGEDRGKT
uniref:Uncharacterized protein n=1 Tax=viral metagenome TaxID=1070528 RepID=A0A6M3IDU1_9ZZZZ